MKIDLTDHIEYIVEKRGDNWAVYSLVMTSFGSKPAKNFIVENKSRKWCDGFATAYRATESRRTPKELPDVTPYKKLLESFKRNDPSCN